MIRVRVPGLPFDRIGIWADPGPGFDLGIAAAHQLHEFLR